MKAHEGLEECSYFVKDCIRMYQYYSKNKYFLYLFQIHGFRCHAEVSHDPRQAVDHRWNILTFPSAPTPISIPSLQSLHEAQPPLPDSDFNTLAALSTTHLLQTKNLIEK